MPKATWIWTLLEFAPRKKADQVELRMIGLWGGQIWEYRTLMLRMGNGDTGRVGQELPAQNRLGCLV